jgi:hypothetical protein
VLIQKLSEGCDFISINLLEFSTFLWTSLFLLLFCLNVSGPYASLVAITTILTVIAVLCSLLLQYGSDEFGQDSPRYTSPKTASLYGESYYIGK